MRHFYEMFVLHSTPVCPKINMLKCMQSESYAASYAFGRIEMYACCVSLTSISQCNRSFVGIFKRPNVTLNTFPSEISTCICTMIDSFIWIRLSRNKFFWSLDMIEMSRMTSKCCILFDFIRSIALTFNEFVSNQQTNPFQILWWKRFFFALIYLLLCRDFYLSATNNNRYTDLTEGTTCYRK